jgi:hypothetical protein
VFRALQPCRFQFSDFDTAPDTEVGRYNLTLYSSNFDAGVVRKMVSKFKEVAIVAVKTMIISSVNRKDDDQYY